ncbi:MAG TPA: hypothetical protein VKP13_04270 [Nitrospira sp.]|nr:hypothetical protein [Nitrospira sp.]
MSLRLVAIGLLSALVCVSDAAASPKTARDKNDLLGPVRAVITKAGGGLQTEIYDLTGRLIEAVVHREHDNTSSRYVFTYDQQGALQEETAYEADRTPIYRKLFAYAHDPAGRQTAVVAAFQDGAFHHAEFSTYDRSENISETIQTDGTMTSRNLFDVLGRILYSSRFRDGQLVSELKRTYDSGGRLIELISYSSGGAVTGKVVHEYDDSGKRIRSTTETFQPNATGRWITTYENDRNGNWIKESTWKETGGAPETDTGPSQAAQERIIDYYEVR